MQAAPTALADRTRNAAALPSAVALARLAALAPKSPCRVCRLVGRPIAGGASRPCVPRTLMLADLG